MSAEGGPETAGFQCGATVYPLTAATTNSLLADVDPALDLLLKFFAAVLSIHLGARWDAEMVKAGLPDLVGKISTLQVPYDPLPFLGTTQIIPPLLALYPVTDTPQEHTRHWYRIDGSLKLLWVLPPLSAAQFLQLYPFLRAATKVIVDRVEQGFDPAYNGGQLDENSAIMEISIDRASYGSVPQLRTELHFPCVEINIAVQERRMPAPGQSVLRGVDTTVQAVTPPGAAVTVTDTALNL